MNNKENTNEIVDRLYKLALLLHLISRLIACVEICVGEDMLDELGLVLISPIALGALWSTSVGIIFVDPFLGCPNPILLILIIISFVLFFLALYKQKKLQMNYNPAFKKICVVFYVEFLFSTTWVHILMERLF